MILLKKINNYCICLLFLIGCSSNDIHKTDKIIKTLQEKEYISKAINYNKRKRFFNDSLHKEFYQYRQKQIDSFLSKKRLKDFIIQDNFFFQHLFSEDDYSLHIYTPDSIYFFGFSSIKSSRSLKSENSNCLYFSFQKDSLIINRHTLYDFPKEKNSCLKENIFPSYTSFYRNGKLKLLMKKDSVIYQKKKNKIMIDLDTSIYTYDSGKICKEKNGVFHCNNGSIEKCDIDSLGYFFNCKIIKQGE